jgi:hypothetical protein
VTDTTASAVPASIELILRLMSVSRRGDYHWRPFKTQIPNPTSQKDPRSQ